MFGPDRPQKHELLDNDGLLLPTPKPPMDRAAIAKYERQMQAAFNAEALGRDCSCDSDVNPFCKTHSHDTHT